MSWLANPECPSRTHLSHRVNPMYYVGFSTATIIASLILFRGFNTSDYVNIVSLIAGFIITFLGVHLLNLSRKPEPRPSGESTHTLLEGGLMNPRVSGRLSTDSNWSTYGGPPWSAGHSRRSTLYRSQDAQLRYAFDDEGVDLELLREEDEERSIEQLKPTSGERSPS